MGVVSAEDYQKDWDMERLRSIGEVVWTSYKAAIHIEPSYVAKVFLTSVKTKLHIVLSQL